MSKGWRFRICKCSCDVEPCRWRQTALHPQTPCDNPVCTTECTKSQLLWCCLRSYTLHIRGLTSGVATYSVALSVVTRVCSCLCLCLCGIGCRRAYPKVADQLLDAWPCWFEYIGPAVLPVSASAASNATNEGIAWECARSHSNPSTFD